MARIVVAKGERLEIAFTSRDDHEVDVDGHVYVGFDNRRLYVTADIPDSTGRVGTIYEERFGKPGTDARVRLPKVGSFWVFHDDPHFVFTVDRVFHDKDELMVEFSTASKEPMHVKGKDNLRHFLEFYSEILRMDE